MHICGASEGFLVKHWVTEAGHMGKLEQSILNDLQLRLVCSVSAHNELRAWMLTRLCVCMCAGRSL